MADVEIAEVTINGRFKENTCERTGCKGKSNKL